MLTEATRFLRDDPAPAVAASIACPVCLRAPSSVLINRPKLDSARCVCVGCELKRTVSMNLGQGMRIALAPPHGPLVVTAIAPGPPVVEV